MTTSTVIKSRFGFAQPSWLLESDSVCKPRHSLLAVATTSGMGRLMIHAIHWILNILHANRDRTRRGLGCIRAADIVVNMALSGQRSTDKRMVILNKL
jgi:hypothetical protein